MLAALIRKELLALWRDPHGLGALFVMPAVFIVVMSLALQDVYSPPLERLPYAVAAAEATPLAAQLAGAWARRHGEAQTLPTDWREALRQGRLRYVVAVEAGFAQTLADPLPAEAVRVRLVADPALDQAVFQALAARLAAQVGELRADAIQAQFFAAAAPGANAIDWLVQAERLGADRLPATAVQQNVPAWLVFGMFFVVAAIAGLFVQEQRDGTLARLTSIGVPQRVQILAKALPYLGVNAVQAAAMFAVGIWLMPLFGADALSLAGADLPALALMLFAISAAAIGFALCLATLVRTHGQANAIGSMLNIVMAGIGGIMVPTFVMPPAMQALAAFSPMNWALDGLLAVLLRQAGVAAVLPQALPLLAFAAVTLAAATLLFPRRIRP